MRNQRRWPARPRARRRPRRGPPGPAPPRGTARSSGGGPRACAASRPSWRSRGRRGARRRPRRSRGPRPWRRRASPRAGGRACGGGAASENHVADARRGRRRVSTPPRGRAAGALRRGRRRKRLFGRGRARRWRAASEQRRRAWRGRWRRLRHLEGENVLAGRRSSGAAAGAADAERVGLVAGRGHAGCLRAFLEPALQQRNRN